MADFENDPAPPPQWIKELRLRTSEGRAQTRMLSFVQIIVVLLTLLVIEIAGLILLPYFTHREANRLLRATQVGLEEVRPFRNDILNLLPPQTGMRYSILAYPETYKNARKLLAQMAGRPDEEKLRLMGEYRDEDENLVTDLLNLCFDGSPEELRVEQFLMDATAQNKTSSSPRDVYLAILDNYFFTAQRSQFSGFPSDAKRLYSRFLLLARRISGSTSLSEDAIVQRQLSRARVRVLVSDAKQALEPEKLRIIQTQSVQKITPLLADSDPLIRGYARFVSASLTWHAGNVPAARELLQGHLDNCASLYDECEFLLAKIVEPADSGNALAQLCSRLADSHPLLDDVYFHRIVTARDHNQRELGLQLLKEAHKRCPNGDRAFNFMTLEAAFLGKQPRTSDEQ